MVTSVEIRPLESVESELSRWPQFGYPDDSCLQEPYPNPFQGMVSLHCGGDEIRWGEVKFVDDIAFREISWTVQNGGGAVGELVVYGHVVSEKFMRDECEAVWVSMVPERKMDDVEESVRQAYAEHLQSIGLSEETATATAETTLVVFLFEDGWMVNNPIAEED
jgi:hypothetical protein